MINFHDKNRYRGRKIFNAITSFLWSIFTFVVVVALAVFLIRACMPWLKALWVTIV